MPASRFTVSFVLGCALLASSTGARAEGNAAAAEAAFDEGKRLMSAGKYAEACPKFAESSRLDPGVGVLLYLGDCYEKAGQTASAWAAFREATSAAHAAGQAAREQTARDRAAALEGKLVRIVIVVPPASDAAGLVVKRDGAGIGRPLWGSPFPVDPGRTQIEAIAPGHKRWSATVDVGKEPVTTINVPVLEASPEAAATAPAPVGPRPEAAPEAPQPGSNGSAQRTLALVAGGIGVAGIGVGAIFGAMTISQWNTVKKDPSCHPVGTSYRCQPGDTAAKDAASAASSDGTISDIGFIGGGVALATGIGLWVFAPSRKAAPQQQGARTTLAIGAGAGGGSLAWMGSF